MTLEHTATLVADTRCGLGESPFWDEATGVLAWVDIQRSVLLSYEEGGSVTTTPLPEETTFAAHALDGGIVAAHPDGLDHITADGVIHSIAPAWLDSQQSRTNDGAVDACGRVWIGSTTRERVAGSGSIGVVEKGEWHRRFDGLTLPNGIGWSIDNQTIYYVDTLAGTIWRAAFDPVTVTVGASTPFFRMDREDGLLDGISLDSRGGVWVAVWGGACLLGLDPDGTVETVVEVAADAVTSCAFAGTRLFITTADPDGAGQAGAGGLFVVDVGVEGVPVAAAGPF